MKLQSSQTFSSELDYCKSRGLSMVSCGERGNNNVNKGLDDSSKKSGMGGLRQVPSDKSENHCGEKGQAAWQEKVGRT